MTTVALGIWPIITLILFSTLGPSRGLIWSVMVGYLFLPEGTHLDPPGLPPLNKTTVVSMSLLLALVVFRKRVAEVPRPEVRNRWFRFFFVALLALLIFSPLGTVLDNPRNLVNGSMVRTGLSWRDAVSMIFSSLIVFIFFLIAARLLSTPEDHADVLTALVAIGLVYTLLVLFEARMSPQLNNWIYGFFPHDWLQHIRGGAFRPVVFLRHGLWVGIFLFAVTIAAFALSRQSNPARRTMYVLAGLWTLAVLLVSRNLGATMLAVLFIPVVLFLTRRMQLRIAAVIALIFLAYPAVRQSDVLPIDRFVSFVEGISVARAQSFETRLNNEAVLLERAWEKPVFGWGGWGRWRIVDERGRDRTIADGVWVITLGERGWAGYIARFGLLSLPLLFLGFAWRRRPVTPATAGMAVMMAGNLIYLVPNSALNPIGILIFGALAGFVQTNGALATTPPPQNEMRSRKTPRYTRFGPEIREQQPIRGVQRSQRAPVSSR